MGPWLFSTERLAVRPKTLADSEALTERANTRSLKVIDKLGMQLSNVLQPRVEIINVLAATRSKAEVIQARASLDADVVRPPQEGPWAPGYYSLSFRDPEGTRLEVNHVPGKAYSSRTPPLTVRRITR